MDIINERYGIIKELNSKTNDIRSFIAEDLNSSERKRFKLNIVKTTAFENSFMEFLRNKFFLIKQIDCSLFSKLYDFTRLISINGVKTIEDSYIYTCEKVDSATYLLEFLKTASWEEILQITVLICKALNYLCKYEMEYKNFNLKNIYVLKTEKKLTIKLQDIITYKLLENIELIEYKNINKDYFEYDVESFAVILLSLLARRQLSNLDIPDFSSIKTSCLKLCTDKNDKKIAECLFGICNKAISSMTDHTTYLFHHIILDINKQLQRTFSVACKAARKDKFISPKTIGRYKEKNKLLSSFYNLYNNVSDNNVCFITAQLGAGKTSFLAELNFLFSLEKCDVYNFPNLGNFNEEQFLIHLMRTMLMNVPLNTVNVLEKEILEGIEILTKGKYPAHKLNMLKYRLINRISNLIAERTASKVAVFIVDDIHLGADFILNLFLHLAVESVNHKKIMLIFSYDEFGIKQNVQAQKMVEVLTAQDNTQKINLCNLSEYETGVLIRHLLQVRHVPYVLINKIYSHTSGSPLFVTEVVKELVYNGDIKKNEITEICMLSNNILDVSLPIQISSNIEQAVKTHLKNLNTEELLLLNAMSIFQNVFTLDDIVNIAAFKKADIKKYFYNFLENNIIAKADSGLSSEYIIVNNILHNTLYAELDPEYKVALHKKIAGIIKQKSKININEYIWHAERAGLAEEVVDYCIKHESVIKKTHTVSAVISIFEKIYTLICETDTDKQLYVLLLLAEAYIDTENVFDCANKILQAEMLLNKRISNKNLIALLYITKTNYEILINVDSRSIEKTLDIAEQAAKKAGDKFVTLSFLKVKSKFLQYSRKHAEGIRVAKKVVKLCGDIKKYQFLKAGALLELGNNFYYSGNFNKAEKIYIEAVKTASKARDFKVKNFALNNLAIIYLNLYQNFSKALSFYNDIIDKSEEYNNVSTKVLAMLNISTLKASAGEYIEAYDLCMDAIKKIKQNQLYNRYLFAYTLLYDFLSVFDDYNAALACKIKIDTMMQDKRILQRPAYIISYTQTSAKIASVFAEYEKEKKLLEKCLEANNFRFAIKKLFMEACLETNKLISKKTDDISALQNIYTAMFTESKYVKLLHLVFYNVLESVRRLIILRRDMDFTPILKYIVKNKISDLSDILKSRMLFILSFIEKEKAEEHLLKALALNSEEFCSFSIDINTELALLYLNSGNTVMGIVRFAEVQKIIGTVMNLIPINKQRAFFNSNRYGRAFDIIDDYLNKKLKPDYRNYNKKFSLKRIQTVLTANTLTLLKNNREFLTDIVNIEKSKTKFKNKTAEDVILKFSNNFLQNIKIFLDFISLNLLATAYDVFIVDNENNIESLFSFGQCKSIEKIAQILKNSVGNQDNVLENESLPAHILLPIKCKNINPMENNICAYLVFISEREINNCNTFGIELCKIYENIFAFLIESYRLHYEASTDKLTSAFTRKYIDMAFNELFDTAKNTGKPFSVLMYDLDHFKIINDTFGHQIGDEVLKATASAAMGVLKKKQILGRFGGEEFLVLLPDTQINQAGFIAENIRKQIEALKFENPEIKITVSIGAVSFPQHAVTAGDLLLKADSALYNAKNSGRNNVCIWNTDFVYKDLKTDRMTGVITGDSLTDAKNILILTEVTASIRKKLGKDMRLKFCLSKIKELTDADTAVIIPIRENKPSERILKPEQTPRAEFKLNKNFIKETVTSKKSFSRVDWDNAVGKDKLTGIPNWNSVIAAPVIYEGKIKAVIYLLKSIRRKEFSSEDLNMTDFFSSCIAPFC
ncbi:diguanylate cyclase [Treponema pedis]|uniref:diguanylate cyclase n=3 Tax=Treponema pedis TaxID=409322 RepID=S6A2C8_9SPIR|nr:diguanylate cyclase [Treponema pedis]AGT45258.1 diguanylate cyclase [Treponema pedis str. T A4]